MIYLDANFLVYCQDSTEKGESARKLLKEIVKGRKAITSTLAIDELMWVVYRNAGKKEIRRIVEEIYSVPNIKVEAVWQEIPLRALDFIEFGLKPRDSFHAAVMKSLGINEIVSDDPDFDRLKWVKRIKL